MKCCLCLAGITISDVALQKSTNQSGQYLNYNSSLAVDGDINTCAQPLAASRSDYAWWQVNLGDLYVVTNVTIYNANADISKWNMEFFENLKTV